MSERFVRLFVVYIHILHSRSLNNVQLWRYGWLGEKKKTRKKCHGYTSTKFWGIHKFQIHGIDGMRCTAKFTQRITMHSDWEMRGHFWYEIT